MLPKTNKQTNTQNRRKKNIKTIMYQKEPNNN